MPSKQTLRNATWSWVLAIGAAGVFAASAQGQTSPSAWGPPIRDARRTFQSPARHWKGIRERNIVMQQTDYSCGAAALATIVRFYWGDDVDEPFFLRAILATLTRQELQDRIENGLSMTDLRKVAVMRGYAASLGKQELAKMAELRVPVIVRIKSDGHEHFVVYRGMAEDRVFLADPIRGNIRLPIEEFARQWPDRVLLVVAKPGSGLHPNSPLLLQTEEMFPVRPELQVLRRQLTLPIGPRPARVRP